LAAKKLKFTKSNDSREILVFFQDEGRFGRINNLTSCWVPKGKRANIGKQIVRQYIYAYTALCPSTGDNFSMIMPSSNTICMDIFLTELSEYYNDKRIIMIMDNAGWHTTEKLKIYENICIWTLPPRAPELNPVEYFWKHIREDKKFNNNIFNSIEEVEEKLEIALYEMKNDKKTVKSFGNYSWLKSQS